MLWFLLTFCVLPPLGISQVINDQCCRRHILGFLRHYQGATNASGTMRTLMVMAATSPCSTVRWDCVLLACQCSLLLLIGNKLLIFVEAVPHLGFYSPNTGTVAAQPPAARVLKHDESGDGGSSSWIALFLAIVLTMFGSRWCDCFLLACQCSLCLLIGNKLLIFVRR